MSTISQVPYGLIALRMALIARCGSTMSWRQSHVSAKSNVGLVGSASAGLRWSVMFVRPDSYTAYCARWMAMGALSKP
jgi:hypothetical protein